jgi:acyl-ACP thioesterase
MRVTDIDLFDDMNNSVYWSGVEEEYLFTTPELLNAPLRITIEHEAPVVLGDKLATVAHPHPAGTTEGLGPGLIDRRVTTLTYAAGDETKAIASIFALSA